MSEGDEETTSGHFWGLIAGLSIGIPCTAFGLAGLWQELSWTFQPHRSMYRTYHRDSQWMTGSCIILFVGLVGLLIFFRSLFSLLGLKFLARWMEFLWEMISGVWGGRG